MNSANAQVVRDHRIATFWYDDLMCTFEPHTHGIHKDTNNEVLSGYQTGGFNHSDDLPGWRLYSISDIRNLTATDRPFGQTRPGYNPNDSRLRHIYARA